MLPTDSVHLGWCSFAAVWLRHTPSTIPGHIIACFSTGEVRAAFERQAAEDWKTFLSCRAREMRPGARLVIVLPAMAEGRPTGFMNFVDCVNTVLGEMADEGAITAQERARMVLGVYARRLDELLTPFEGNGQFQRLMVEDCETAPLPDPAWVDYQQDGDKQALATKQALFFRSVFMPSLASALTRVRAGNLETMHSFADRLQDHLTHCLASHPISADLFVQMLVLAKSE